jgi:hypothetical protein
VVVGAGLDLAEGVPFGPFVHVADLPFEFGDPMIGTVVPVVRRG